MSKELEIAKRYLESKGYEISEIATEALKESKEFKVNLPAKWSDGNHEYEVTRPHPGRFGLNVDGKSMMSTLNLRDVNNYLQKNYNTEIPDTTQNSDVDEHLEVAPNHTSTTAEKVAYVKKMVEKAKNEGDEHSAWDIVDFLYDSLLLDEIPLDESKEMREAHTVELYKSHSSDPERKKFSDYNAAKEFADSQTDNYEEILITIPAAGGPSTVNSWSKKDGWFRTVESNEMNESNYYWSGFGYCIYGNGGKYEVVNGEGDVVYTAEDTLDAKKWCKDNKTSSKWRADAKWDWDRESKEMNESVDDRQMRRIVKAIAEEVIRAKGENNSTGTFDAFIRKMIINWATSGQGRDFIKAAIEKSFDKEFNKTNEGAMSDADIERQEGGDREEAPTRPGRKPNGDEKDDGVFTPGSEDDRLRKGLKDSIREAFSKKSEAKSIVVNVPDDLVGQPSPKFKVVYSTYKGGQTTQYIEATDEESAKAIIRGRCKRTGKKPEFISVEKYEPEINESTALDYEYMKGMNPVAIGSRVADALGDDATDEEIMAEISKIIDDDYNGGVTDNERNRQRAFERAKNSIEYSKKMQESDPMGGHKYQVGGSTPNVTETGTDYDVHDGGYKEDPKSAIITWLQLSQKNPTMISIDTNKNAYAQELLQWVVDNEEEFRSLCDKYQCPYKVDYMVNGCKKKLERPSNFETKYNYPDQIYPFALG